MKPALAWLCLSLSTLAWGGATEVRAPLADRPTKHSMPDVPKESEHFDANPQKFKCLEDCQKPIIQCLGRCTDDPACPEQCGGEKLARCAETCGLVKKQ